MTEALQPAPGGGYEEFVMTGDVILQVKSSPPSPKRKSRLTDDSPSSSNIGNAIAAANDSSANLVSQNNDNPTSSYDYMLTPDFRTQQTNNHNGNSSSSLEHVNTSVTTTEPATTHNDNASEYSFDSSNSMSSDDSFPEDVIETNFTNGGVVFGSLRKVDEPSAHRLAKRLFNLDGFKRTDVAYHLTRDNQFSRKVNEEYLKYFDFTDKNLVQALRQFLEHFALVGETQERERVLNHFTNRYLQCNPSALHVDYNSHDACHTLTCAIMLLNTDLHSQHFGKKMSLNDFIENLSGLNNDKDFSKEILKLYYTSIKQEKLTWARDTTGSDRSSEHGPSNGTNGHSTGTVSESLVKFTKEPDHEEYKRGILYKKHCKGPDLKPVGTGKRGWKKHYVILRGTVMYLLKSPTADLGSKSTKEIWIHHCLAQVDRVYKRKPCVFSLRTADWSEYLFAAPNIDELENWVNKLNEVAALLSAEPLAAGVGSQNKFHRPLLPSTHTQLDMVQQCEVHEQLMLKIKQEITEDEKYKPDRSSSKQEVTNYLDKMQYLKFELQRYVVYAHLLKDRIEWMRKGGTTIGEMDESTPAAAQPLPTDPNSKAAAVDQFHGHSFYSEDGMYVHLQHETTQL